MHIHIIDHLEAYDEARVMRLIDTLPQWRKEAALRHKHLTGKRECALAYLALCELLQTHYAITSMPRFDYGTNDKPVLTDYPHIHFNLSHCRSAVGCVVSDKPCGLDIERIRRAEDALIRHTMNEEEQTEIANAADKDLAFTILWTRKEAVLKLAGTGISGGLHNALSPDKLESISLTTTARTDYVFSTAVAKEKD